MIMQWLKGKLLCSWLGHAYEYSWWCKRCGHYLPKPRGVNRCT
jgi:hypothetical protein